MRPGMLGLRARGGYSLLGIVVSIGLVLLLAALGTTDSLGVMGTYRAGVEVRQVREVLVEARSLARTTRRCVLVETGSHQMTTTIYTSCDPVLSGPESITVATFSDEILIGTFSTVEGDLLFTARGDVDTSAPVVLTVDTAQGSAVTYRIYPATGSVRRI